MNRTMKGKVMIEGQELTISNPTKLLFPEMGITKAMYLQRLTALSPWLLKHCQDRYLTTIRYPDGVTGKSFYQKNCPAPTPAFVQTDEREGIHYVKLQSLPVLLWLGNLACLEFHASFDRISDRDHPTEWVLDIDPSLEEEPRIMEAASLVGELLESLGIASTPKTSGATGIQIIVPLIPDLTFDELRRIGEFVGTFLSNKYPRLFTIERLKKLRGDLIYIDYLQHYQGKTIIAPYSPRARNRATVSTPLYWEEVRRNVAITDFNLLNIEARLAQEGDLLDLVAPQPLRHILAFISGSKKGQSE
ncbi:DNA polymerase domain-containing protein [Paenibacillus baekrokdamisoli]|uniref:DNA polymerase domain-containing protein n=1 Tax=Paenibacillus baekrokdamisoli TaxID=1712516 RepID=A0A3G9IZZ0_9BACL|nr:non-homologous end-joining DNA ligase [Paenibacillus baekrokdamisoli]MBB3071452.1 bifunctional non-homologous end joining protein LigD [Paenibacillus baekrokdamisoli]BBH24517.1 DNA polymerase domain-containing protein [Paenibacillus baekrokdamisoli]